MSNSVSSSEDRALELLSQGIEANIVANALGVSESRISQLISDPNFASRLANARFEKLRKHNATDDEYDKLETQLLEQLKRVLPLAMKPMEITRMLQIINSAKRRGASSPENIHRTKAVVRLSMPQQVVNRYKMNSAGQVIEAQVDGETQALVTIQSGNIQRLANEHRATDTLLQSQDTSIRQRDRPRDERTEADGKVFVKRAGREQDLLSELGFAIELEVTVGT